MSNRQRFYLALFVAFIVIALHKLAFELYLYWTYKWVDIPMHIFGGFMAGLFTFVLLRAVGWRESRKNVLAGVIFVGVSWEILELFYRVDIVDMYYWLDTCKDLLDDTIGGLLSLYIWKKIPNQKLPN